MDAISFVLGVRSVHLRASELKDLIYSENALNDNHEISYHEDVPTRIHAQQLDNDLVLSVALDGQKSDMIYILTLYRSNNLWQMREAEMGWRCQGQDSFTPVPCP